MKTKNRFGLSKFVMVSVAMILFAQDSFANFPQKLMSEYQKYQTSIAQGIQLSKLSDAQLYKLGIWVVKETLYPSQFTEFVGYCRLKNPNALGCVLPENIVIDYAKYPSISFLVVIPDDENIRRHELTHIAQNRARLIAPEACEEDPRHPEFLEALYLLNPMELAAHSNDVSPPLAITDTLNHFMTGSMPDGKTLDRVSRRDLQLEMFNAIHLIANKNWNYLQFFEYVCGPNKH